MKERILLLIGLMVAGLVLASCETTGPPPDDGPPGYGAREDGPPSPFIGRRSTSDSAAMKRMKSTRGFY